MNNGEIWVKRKHVQINFYSPIELLGILSRNQEEKVLFIPTQKEEFEDMKRNGNFYCEWDRRYFVTIYQKQYLGDSND